MTQLALRKWGFEVWGCTDGATVSKCKICNLDKWECTIFKDDTKFEFLYKITGEV
jgi:hypothetical protein